MLATKQQNIYSTIGFDDVLREPVEVKYFDVTVTLDATVQGSVKRDSLGQLEITSLDFDEMYLVVPGLMHELIKLDMNDFEANQKQLFELFLKAINQKLLDRAKAADDSDWNYIHE